MRYALMVLTMLITLSSAWLITLSSAWAADTTYRDQRQPSFTLLVPDCWTASRTDQGVTLRHGKSSFELWIISGTAQPGAALVQIRRSLKASGRSSARSTPAG